MVPRIVYLVLGLLLVGAAYNFTVGPHWVPWGGDSNSDNNKGIDLMNLPAGFDQTASFMNNTYPSNDTMIYLGKDAQGIDHFIAKPDTNVKTDEVDSVDNPDNGTKDSKPEIKTYSAEEMREWISPALDLQTTNIKNFEPFGSVQEAQDYFKDSYAWDEDHEYKWNTDEAGYKIAKNHKNDDPAKTIFFGKDDIFAVVPNGVVAQIYKLDQDGDFATASPDDVEVIAVDRLKKSPKD